MKNATPPTPPPAPTKSRQTRIAHALSDARRASSADQTIADADQTAADVDQVSSDSDQNASDSDQTAAENDQRASDRDQQTADRDQATHHDLTSAARSAYTRSRDNRVDASMERLGNRHRRGSTARERDVTGVNRDRMAEIRDEGGRGRDAHAADLAPASTKRERQLLAQLELLRDHAARDRARAAEDRARAAADRAASARERSRLEAELQEAHLDGLTGVYRREMGRLALSNEIDRARRSDGQFVLAFVDVDLLKAVNDRDGHAAGDKVLRTVVAEMRSRTRSFDPIVRYGGDEFICGLAGTNLDEAASRFEAIAQAVENQAKVGISVGLAELRPGDTPESLTGRADAAMLKVKSTHHARA